MIAHFVLPFLILGAPSAAAAEGVPSLAELKTKLAQFAPVDLKVDLAGLSADDKKVLAHLIKASKIMDEIFWRQV
jgi:hypothetical protein